MNSDKMGLRIDFEAKCCRLHQASYVDCVLWFIAKSCYFGPHVTWFLGDFFMNPPGHTKMQNQLVNLSHSFDMDCMTATKHLKMLSCIHRIMNGKGLQLILYLNVRHPLCPRLVIYHTILVCTKICDFYIFGAIFSWTHLVTLRCKINW